MTETDDHIFTFGGEIIKPTWLVQDLIPLGHLCLFLAQSGKGKSFLLEGLTAHILSGVNFCGKVVEAGDVVILDQDTPSNVLTSRLNRFKAGLSEPLLYHLYLHSMENLSLADGSLIKCLSRHTDAKLIIIDSLHSVCGKSNPNDTQAMSVFSTLKSKCLRPDCTICVIHHLSEKENPTLQDLMDGNKHFSGMGSSVVKQQADSEFILSSSATDGKIDQIYLRPIAKRQAISQQVHLFRMIEPDDDTIRWEFGGLLESNVTEIEADLILLLHSTGAMLTIDEARTKMGKKWGETPIRKAFVSLEKQGKVLMAREAHNMFRYRLSRAPVLTKTAASERSSSIVTPEPPPPEIVTSS